MNHYLIHISVCTIHTNQRTNTNTVFFYNYTHSYEATTQPYVTSTRAQNPYSYKSTERPKPTRQSTTESVFKYYQYTTRKPFNFFTAKTTTAKPKTTTYPPSINKYSITSTKSPYDFKDFATQPPKTTAKAIDKSVQPKTGFYNKAFDGYFSRTTTKSPYQVKGVKPVFKIGTFYSQAKSYDNSIRPDANSQQVQIEPARLVFSYQRNLTTGGTQH